MKKKVNFIKLIILILIPLVVGFVSSMITKDAMISFNMMKKPPLSPPGILFPIVWTILYIMMGIASFLVVNNNDNTVKSIKNKWITIYIIQLVFNFFWLIIFFKLRMYYFGFIWLVVLWILVLVLILNGKKINLKSVYLLIPYIIWMTFAGYLNIGVALLN